MLTKLKRARDRFFGIGDADTSVPVLDGALKPNNILETAEIYLECQGLDDMLLDQQGKLIIAHGGTVSQVSDDGSLTAIYQTETPLQALAKYNDGLVAASANGLHFINGQLDGKQINQLDDQPVSCINALSQGADNKLLISIGSSKTAYTEWTADLLQHGNTGRLLEYDPVTNQSNALAKNLEYCYGVCFDGSRIIYSESWAHQVQILSGSSVSNGLSQIAGYPGRISMASDGGYWLCIFAPRNQLLELVLREDDFRNEMMRTVEPRYWIAPAYSSGNDFLEPLQQGSVRQMGILKPWAPARSYGLVLRLSQDFSPMYSLHSRVGGKHHGITAVLELGQELLVLSKGSGRILRVPLDNFQG